MLDISILGDPADVNPAIPVAGTPSFDMLPFGVTIPATVPQRSEIPEGLKYYSVFQDGKTGKHDLGI